MGLLISSDCLRALLREPQGSTPFSVPLFRTAAALRETPDNAQNDLCLRLRVRENARDMALCVAEMLVAQCARAVAERGVFTLALSGGRTPLELFRLLRSDAWKDRLDWPRMRVFWADERCVPPDHPDSNAGTALRELLDHVPVGQVYRMQGEDVPAQAASAYAETLRTAVPPTVQSAAPVEKPTSCAPVSLRDSSVPRLDCILLGIGTDGHTASLFPNGGLLEETSRLVADGCAPDGRSRLTLTFPVLNAARCCLFTVSGAEKRAKLAACLNLTAEPLLPAQRIRPWDGELVWVIQQDALPNKAAGEERLQR